MCEIAKLINAYRELANKTFGFIQEYFDGVVPAGRPDPEIYWKTKEIYEWMEGWQEGCERNECDEASVYALLEEYLAYAECYLNQGNPWKNRENDRCTCRNTILNSVQMVANLTVFLKVLEKDGVISVVEKCLALDGKWQVHSVHSGYVLPEALTSLSALTTLSA